MLVKYGVARRHITHLTKAFGNAVLYLVELLVDVRYYERCQQSVGIRRISDSSKAYQLETKIQTQTPIYFRHQWTH